MTTTTGSTSPESVDRQTLRGEHTPRGRYHRGVFMSRNEEPRHSAVVIGAIGGLLVGYVLWLAAITVGDDLTTVSKWSVAVLLASGALAVAAVICGVLMRWRRRYGWSAFAFGVPVLPLALTLAVLANLYL